jgi:hypothetical protein
MNEDQRDREFEEIRSMWKPTTPPASLRESVLRQYRVQSANPGGRRRWAIWAPLPVAASLAIASGLLWNAAPEDRFRAVASPRFIVVSQGEHP